MVDEPHCRRANSKMLDPHRQKLLVHRDELITLIRNARPNPEMPSKFRDLKKSWLGSDGRIIWPRLQPSTIAATGSVPILAVLVLRRVQDLAPRARNLTQIAV
jgi:hypothetical protein